MPLMVRAPRAAPAPLPCRRYQRLLDQTTVYPLARWAAFGGVLLLFLLRIYYLSGWFIVCYGLGIYLLNLFIGFLSPQVGVRARRPWMTAVK